MCQNRHSPFLQYLWYLRDHTAYESSDENTLAEETEETEGRSMQIIMPHFLTSFVFQEDLINKKITVNLFNKHACIIRIF